MARTASPLMTAIGSGWHQLEIAMEEWRGKQRTVGVHRLHMPSGLDSLRRLPIPRQQLVEPIDRVSIDHALEHVAQIGVRLNAIHLASFDKRTKRRPSLSANIRACEKMILSSERDRTDGALNRIGIEL